MLYTLCTSAIVPIAEFCFQSFLDEVLLPSRVPSHQAGGAGSPDGNRSRSLPAAPASSHLGRSGDPDAFSCTPDSVSVSQMFRLRPGGPAFSRTVPAAAPLSPGMSTADLFNDDDVMDADLLNACEAAEAGTESAQSATVGAVWPESHHLSAAAPGTRDMLDGIGKGSAESAELRSSTDTPSGIATAAGRHLAFNPGSGADSLPVVSEAAPRDSLLADTILPSRQSRDACQSPDGVRAGVRRSMGSTVKRRFPGPAGILPNTVRVPNGTSQPAYLLIIIFIILLIIIIVMILLILSAYLAISLVIC